MLIVLLQVAATTSVVTAENATLRQQIVPLNCMFETVNDGSGTIHYVTPAECGIVLEPTITPITPGDKDTETDTQSGSRQPLFISRTPLGGKTRALQQPSYGHTYSFGAHGAIIAKSSEADKKIAASNNTKVTTFVAVTSAVILVVASGLLLL